MSKDVPGEILFRNKMGFGVPMNFWMKGQLKNSVQNELFDKGGIISELFNQDYIKKVWDLVQLNNVRGFAKADFSYRMWILFIFSRWFKKYIKNEQ